MFAERKKKLSLLQTMHKPSNNRNIEVDLSG